MERDLKEYMVYKISEAKAFIRFIYQMVIHSNLTTNFKNNYHIHIKSPIADGVNKYKEYSSIKRNEILRRNEKLKVFKIPVLD